MTGGMPVRIDGTVVFPDGRTHLVRITASGYQQYAASLKQLGDAKVVLDALTLAFAEVSKESR